MYILLILKLLIIMTLFIYVSFGNAAGADGAIKANDDEQFDYITVISTADTKM